MRTEQIGRLFCCSFDNCCVVRVSRIRELPSGDYRGLVEVCDGDVLLHSSVANICVATGRQAIVRSLNGSPHNWRAMIDAACADIIRRLMRGSPTVEICSEVPVIPQRYLVDPFLPLDQPTLLFGKPGSTKSFLALLMIVLVQLPLPKNDFRWTTSQKCTNCLYLDNETSRDTVHRRLQELLRGMELPPLHIHYKRLTGPLVSELESVQRTILDEKIGFVVLDSAGKGCGGDITQAGPVNDFFTALSQLGVTTLVVHHQPKDELSKNKSPYGSAYFEANARSVWHIERGEGSEDDFLVMLRHTKSNDSALHRPIGLKVRFGKTAEGKSVQFGLSDLRDSEFAVKLPLRERIVGLLSSCQLSAPDIATQLGEHQDKVRTILNRNERTFVKVNNLWGLLSSERP